MPLFFVKQIDDLITLLITKKTYFHSNWNSRDFKNSSSDHTSIALTKNFTILGQVKNVGITYFNVCLENMLVSFPCNQIITTFLIDFGFLFVKNNSSRSPKLKFIQQKWKINTFIRLEE